MANESRSTMSEFTKHTNLVSANRSVIENIKLLEGKRLKPYYCPSGHPTIGYGHLIKRGEYFNALTDKQADSLLRVDFNTRLNYIDSTLSYNKRLALAHFIFNVGIGAYLKSTLHKKVQAGMSIDTEIVKWNKYHKNGILVASRHLSKARAFELEIYKVSNQFDVALKTSKEIKVGNQSTYFRELSHIRTLYKVYDC